MAEPKMLKVIQPNDISPPRVVPRPLKEITIGQVQLNTSFSGQYYFPLAAGFIQAYAKKHLKHTDSYNFKELIYKFPKSPKQVDEICERLSECDLAVFGNYTWGEQHSLALARGFKRRNPNGIVVFGGPQVPDSKKQFRRNKTLDLTPEEMKSSRIHFTENYHRAYPYIDICIHGEGERVFTKVLEQMAIDGCRDKSSIPSASYLDTDGNFQFNNKLERMNDRELAEVPSPFTTGVFDGLISACPDQVFIIMHESNRGCPFNCTYCDWGGATEDRVSRFPMDQIYNDIMWGGEHKVPYWFMCDANWGILERDEQIAEFFAESKAKYGYPDAVSTQNSKNPRAHTIRALKVLEKAGLNKATVMSQQSLNPATLKAVRRDNMKLDEYYAMQRELASQKIFTMTDLILGMPEETHESTIESIATLITNGQHNRIQFNVLSVLINTEMANREYQARYGFKTVMTNIINAHGSKDDASSGINELQEFVVGTNTMPPEDWIKTRVLCWMVNFIYFNKLLQIPIIILNRVYKLSYREVLEVFSAGNFLKYGDFPILKEVEDFFTKCARDIQEGREAEFVYSKEWLNTYWPPDEYILIKLCQEDKLESFYLEAEKLLLKLIENKPPPHVLRQALFLNSQLMKKPFQTEDAIIRLTYNVWEIYKKVLVGQDVQLMYQPKEYVIDRTSETWPTWDEWSKKVIWYGTRRGAHLYGSKNPHTEIAGHH